MTSEQTFAAAMLLVCLGISGCAATVSTGSTPAHDNLDAITWLQTSTEYAAVTTGIYATARAALREIAQTEPERVRSMAIVLDVDETVLDNSRYQGQLVFDDERYESESWDRWISLRSAVEVPGVVDFIRTSQSLGFHVVFITNRTCLTRPGTTEYCPQKAETFANLEAIGIEIGSTTLFLRGERPSERCRAILTEAEQEDDVWSSDKTSRRGCVTLDHDIVMLFGDQLGDFTEVEADLSEGGGRQLAAEYEEYWGRTWFMLPNPTYGGWRPRTSPEKRSLIRGIE